MTNNKNISKKQISINLVANVISYSSNILISFVLTPFLIDALGKDVYSFYPIANSIVSYLSILTAALNTMASRFFTVEIVNGNDKEANKYYSSVLASNVVISTIMLIPMSVIVVFLDNFLNVPINAIAAIRMLFSMVFASAIVNVIGSIYGIATFAKNRIDLRSVGEIITAIIRLVLYIVFYLTLPPSIVYVGIVTFIVTVISICIQVVYTRKLLPEIRFKKSDISIIHLKKLLSSTIWNIIFTFGNVLLSGLTLVMLNILYDADASGSLSIVQTVPTFLNGVISMLVGVFFPVITYKVAEKDTQGIVDQITTAQRIIAIIGCAVVSVFSALAPEFFALWVPNEDALFLSKLSMIAIIPHVVVSCTWILSNLNIAMNKVKYPALFTVAIGVLNVIVAIGARYIFDAPFYFVQIISSLLQILWTGVFLPLYASRELGVSIKTFYPPLLRALIAVFLCFALTFISKKFFVFNNWIIFIIFGGVVGSISLIVFAVAEFGIKNLKTQLMNFRIHSR